MATVGGVIVPFDTDSQAFVTSLGKAEKQLASTQVKMNRSLAKIDGGFTRLGQAAKRVRGNIAAMAAVVVGAVFGAATGSALKYSEALGLAADKLGVTTEALQQFRFAAEQVGVSNQQADIALQRFTRRLAEAQQGTGTLKEVFEQYGIALENTDGTMRSASEVLGDLADAAQNAGTSQERLRIAFKAFDTEGAALVNILSQGREGMKQFEDQAKSLGAIIDSDLVRKGQALANAWGTVWTGVINGLRSAFISFIGFITEGIVGALDLAAAAVENLGSLFAKVDIDFFQEQAQSFKDTAAGIKAYADVLREATKDQEDFSAEITITNGKLENTRQQLKDAQKEAKDLEKATSSLESEFKSFGRSAAASLTDVIQGTREWSDALLDLAASAAEAALQSGVGSLIDSVFGASTGGGGSIFGSLFGGARREGGPVVGGRSYIVGENGPERFVPSTMGTIQPGAGGGATFNIDARGASAEAVRRLEMMVANLHGSIEPRAVRAVTDFNRRRGR